MERPFSLLGPVRGGLLGPVRGGWWSGTRQKPEFPFSLLVEYFVYFHKERITAV